ncbi:MAG TPA: hypothetical protein VG675_16165 [Bryobacteraceae bacterium]|nr:hypothetical protein [Bryobacteraceae bacterium]
MAVAVVVLTGCGLCSNQIVKEVPSPDGTKKAIIFVRDCGATTGFSTDVSVINANETLPSSAGNVFIADANHGGVPLAKNNALDVNAVWTSANRLVIHYPAGARNFLQDPARAGVAIQYLPRK